MSHIASCASTLGVVNSELFKKALELVAKKHNGTVTDHVFNYGTVPTRKWKENKLIGAIKTERLSRGIGAVISNGKLQFVGNDENREKEYKDMIKEIEKTYRILGYVLALSQRGYKVDDVSKAQIGVLIQGEKD